MANARDSFLERFIQTHLSSTAGGSLSKYYEDDPTVLGFNILFSFEGADSPLFNESNQGESAISYLENIDEGDRTKWEDTDIDTRLGEGGRAASLKEFKERLRDLVMYYPYYFTSAAGMDGLYNMDGNISYMDDKILTINTLESIDNRMGAMVEAYMRACYDVFERREVIPVNLREFSMTIFISEIRNFRTFVEVSQLKDKERDNLGLINLNDAFSVYKYEFFDCEFIFKDSQPWLADMNMGKGDIADNQFAIKLGRFRPSHRMRFVDAFASERDFKVFSPTIGGKRDDDDDVAKRLSKMVSENVELFDDLIKKEQGIIMGNNDIGNVVTQGLYDKLLNPLDAKIKQAILGNVFLESNASIADAANQIANGKNPINLVGETLNSELQSRFGDASAAIIKSILEKGELTNGQIDVGAPYKTSTDLFQQNVLNFEKAPFTSVLNMFIKGTIGNVFD